MLPEHREYERTVTTLVDAFVKSRVAVYVGAVQDTLDQRLGAGSYRGSFFNIGVDGQIYVGAIATTGLAFLAAERPVPPGLLLPAVLLAGLVGGAVFGAIPAVLRARWGVSEIFLTVMLYFVAFYLTDYLTTGPWNDPVSGEAITRPIPGTATLPMLMPEAGGHAGILLAVAASILVAMLLGRSVLGYEIRAAGDNARAARIGGIDLGRITLVTLAASGGLAGLAGGSR